LKKIAIILAGEKRGTLGGFNRNSKNTGTEEKECYGRGSIEIPNRGYNRGFQKK